MHGLQVPDTNFTILDATSQEAINMLMIYSTS